MKSSPLAVCIFAACMFVPSPLQAEPGVRTLDAFTNDDGSTPDGADAKRDDTSSLRKALAAGPGIVRIGRGFYRFGNVLIPEGVTVAGQGKATIVRSNGAASIFTQKNVADWALHDLVLDGEAPNSTPKDWPKRKDAGKAGLFTEGCHGYEVVGVTARNFEGAGFQFTRSKNTGAGTLTRLSATGCHVGIRFDVRAEYISASQLTCRNNITGCVIHAGNSNIVASNFCDNVDGMLIEDKENGSHGSIANCLFNHNIRHALHVRQIKNGMAISNCCFFYGTLKVEKSMGVNIASSLVSCHVHTEGPKANRFSGNHIIPLQWQFTFSPADILEGNYTKDGPWPEGNKK